MALTRRTITRNSNIRRMPTRYSKVATPNTTNFAKTKNELTTKQQNYIKNIGYTPQIPPEFRSDRNSTGVWKAFEFIDRPLSGYFGGLTRQKQRNTEDSADGKFTIKERLEGFAEFGRGVQEGTFGDIDYDATHLYSDIAANPKTRYDKSAGEKLMTNLPMFIPPLILPTVLSNIENSVPEKTLKNKTFQQGAGFLTEILHPDVTDLIPVGKVAKVVGKGAKIGGKAIGFSDEALDIAKQLRKVPSVPTIEAGARKIGALPSQFPLFKKARSLRNRSEGMNEEIAAGYNKLLQNKLDDRGFKELVATIDGKIGVTDPDTAKKVISELENSRITIKKLADEGVDFADPKVQDKIFRTAAGVDKQTYRAKLPKTVDQIRFDAKELYDQSFNDEVGKIIEREFFNGDPLKGSREMLADGTWIGHKSRFPDWLEGGQRQQKVIDGVIDHFIVDKQFKKGSLVDDVIQIIKKRADESATDIVTKIAEPELSKVSKAKFYKSTAFDPRYEEVTRPIRTMIDAYITPQLVNSGQITAEQAAAAKGSYIRKLYEAYQKAGVPRTQWATSGGSKLGTELKSLKTDRGNALRVLEWVKEHGHQDIKVRAILDEFQGQALKLLGNDNLTEKQIKKLNELANVNKKALMETLGEEEFLNLAHLQRVNKGLITDASLVLPETISQQMRLIERYSFLDWTGKQFAKDLQSYAGDHSGLTQIPQSDVFGELAGKFLPNEIADDIQGIFAPKGEFSKNLNKATNYWKKLKLFAPFNTATNARNFISNLVLNSSVANGLPIFRFDIYGKAMFDYENFGKYTEILTKKGFLSNTFASQQIKKGLKGVADSDGAIKKGANLLVDTNARIPYTPIGWGADTFEAIEESGKIAQVIWQVEHNGKTIEEAMEIANKALFDYSSLPTALRNASNTVMPFISFKYFATKLALDTFYNRTGKVMRGARALKGFESFTDDQANEEDLPDYIKEDRMFYLRTPWMDKKGNPRYLDLKYLLPYGDLTSGYRPQDLILGNPFVGTAFEVGSNRNTYFDSPISPEGTPLKQDIFNRTKYALSALGPKTPVTGYDLQKLTSLEELGGTGMDKYGRQVSLSNTIPDVLFGTKFREVDPDAQRRINLSNNRSAIKAVEKEIFKIRSDKSLSQRERDQKLKEYYAEKQRLQQQ